ncbi:MAG: DUF6516 family protein [Pseudomonadota bacterium]|nr:DUF6516 family protein [Pseudomonadota bacterium]
MQAEVIQKERLQVSERGFVEIVIWVVPAPIPPSTHGYKYRLAYVVDGVCVVRFDNERGKGDHYHRGSEEVPYRFTTLAALLEDFWAQVSDWRE